MEFLHYLNSFIAVFCWQFNIWNFATISQVFHESCVIDPHQLCRTSTIVGSFNPFEKYDRQIGSFPQGSGWTLKMFETTS